MMYLGIVCIPKGVQYQAGSDITLTQSLVKIARRIKVARGSVENTRSPRMAKIQSATFQMLDIADR